MAGAYEGKCNKGHANENVYNGEFVPGEKGRQRCTEIPILDGYWLDDEYAGTEKKVYALIDRSTSV